MSRASNSAQMAGTTLDRYIGYLTTITDVTQKSAASVGESLKTVYSRYQNIAAGKFVAAQSDIDSENYDESSWQGLNDVEKALKALGINIRSSVDTFRNFDDVMDEIASKWSTFSDVQKSGIATSLAGTRQRENLITLFENWDLVTKYEQISENAYGTAAKKMEAYSDSVEAAKTRISAAVEKFVISLNASDGLKKFYNGIADLTENFGTLATAVSIILAYINRGSVVTTVSAGIGKIVGTMGRMASYINNQQISNSVLGKGSGNYIANGWSLAMDNAQETYMASVRQSYQQGMSNFIDSMSGVSSDWKTLTKAYMLPLQNTIFGLTEAQREQWVSSINQVTLGQEEAIVAARKLVTERDSVMIQALLNGTTQEERNIILQQIAKERVANGQTDALTSAKKDYEIAVRKAASLVGSKEGQYLGGQLRNYNEVNPKQAIYEGTGQMIGSMFGASIGTSIGKTLTDKLGLSNSAAQVAGTVGGMALGSIGGKAVGGLLAGAGITTGGIASIAALVVAGVASLYFSQENKRKEEAQKMVQEAVDKYTEMSNASIDTSKYDELVKRVDSLGNNVSLTDEQYKEFLDTSNKLAESFPDLIVRTDEAGNSFLGLNGKVGTVTDSVNELVDSLQKEADFKLLDSDYFDQVVDEATSSRSDLEKQIKKKKDEASRYVNRASAFKEGGELRQQYLDKAQELFAEANNLQRQLDAMGSIGYSDYKDQVEAVIRRSSALSDSYENLTDEQRQYVDMVKQSMNFDGMSTSEVKAHTTEVMSEAIKNAPKMEDAFKAYLEVDDSISPDEFTKVRQNLLKGILDNADFLTEDEKGQLLIKVGFTLVGDTWVDNENPIESIQRDFNVKKYTNSDQMSITKLKKLSNEDVKKVWGYLSNGDITADSSMNTVVDMLYADRDMPQTLELADNYVDQLSTLAESASKELEKMTFKDWQGIDEGELVEKFGKLPEAWREGIKGIKEAIDDGDLGEEDLDNRLKSLTQTMGSSIMDATDQLARLSLENAFSPQQLTDDIDGIIDSFSELQKALKAVAESYDMLYEAQQEQNKYGKLSLSTVVDLVTENANYADVIEFQKDAETGRVTSMKLVANAQEIMNKIQIEAIKDNLREAIAKNDVTLATLKSEEADIQKAIAQKTNVEQDENAVKSGNKVGQVLTKVAKIAARVATIFGAIRSGDSLTEAWYAAERAADSVESWNDIDFGANYGSKTLEDLQEDLSKNQKQQADLNKQNDVFKASMELNEDNIDSQLRGYAKHNDESKSGDLEDRLNALEGIYQKEYYLRKSYKDFGNINAGSEAAYMNSTYYAGLKQVYQLESQYYASKLPKGKKVTEYSKDQLGYLQKYQEVQIKLNNLDDEEWEDRINILELQGASLEKLIEANKEYEKTSDSLQEHIERQKKILELEIQQLELHKEVSEWQRDNTDRLIDRLSGDAYSNDAYDRAINQQVSAVNDEIADTQSIIQKYYAKAVDAYEQTGHTHAEALRLAYTGNNEYSEKLRSAMTDYYNLIDKRTEYTIKQMEDKADDLNRRLDLIEKEKPDEWFKIGDIDSYYTQRMDLLQKQVELYQDALKDTSDMTDEQIQNIVDSLNEATISLKEAQIDNLKDQTDLQSKQYDAIVYRINLWKDEIQDAIDAVEKAYEDEIKPIQDINDELERQGKLEDLLAAKKAAQREKERVFREGIGWVYESPVDKRRQAEKDIDDFNRQDKLDDLEKTKDAEVKALEDLSKAWDLYLKELEWDYNEFERINNERILEELMGCETEEEVRKRITDDMKQFNKDALANYKEYDTIFQDNLLTPYKNNLVELQKLYEQTAQLVNSINGLWVNNNNNLTYDQLLANSAANNKLDLSIDYSAQMLAAKDEETFWKLANLRDQKALEKGIDISGNNPKYRSNQSFYNQWKNGYQGANANLNNLNWTKDYSAAMLNASSEEEFWNLAAQRDAKAALRGLDTTGADSRYRSNDEFYKLWAVNHKDLATYSHQNKKTLDVDNNFWKAYNQTDSSLKNESVKTTDAYVNKMCGEWVEYNNQYQQALLDPMNENNGTLDYLREQMSNVYDQIAQRMQLSVNEIQTIGAQMVDAQNQVYTSLAESVQRTQELYQQSLATGKSYSLGGGVSIDASKGGSGGWSEAEMNEGFNKSSGDNLIASDGKSYKLDTSSKYAVRPPSMARDTSRAGTTISAGGYKITYDKNGYATSRTKEKSSTKSYSTGIENGPVTYTGLAMLHGTPGNPEFVLNSDQAYTLLRNMATTKLPEMQKVSGGETQGTQYIVQGDIVLENTNNPAQFWDDVSKAMSNRHNVTKNR